MRSVKEMALRALPGGDWRFDEPMSRWTTLRVGGPAAALLFIRRQGEVAVARALAEDFGIPFFVMGRGSNLLVRDGGLPGITVCFAEGLSEAEWHEGGVTAQAGLSLPRLARAAIERGLDGLTWAVGIPGTLGGALAMNAGAYGGSLSDVVTEVMTLLPGGEVRVMDAPACGFSYRCSAFRDGVIALSARLTLASASVEALAARAVEHASARAEKQPLDFPSAGSFFKRPQGDYAARLIDAAGLRGLRVGDAAVSEKHAGFIVNLRAATAADILALMREIQKRVRDLSGLELEPEVKIVGVA